MVRDRVGRSALLNLRREWRHCWTLFAKAAVLQLDQQHSQKLGALYPLHNRTTNNNWMMLRLRASEVSGHLFGLFSVEGKIVCFAPGWQLLQLPSISSLIFTADKADHCGVIYKFHNVVMLNPEGRFWSYVLCHMML